MGGTDLRVSKQLMKRADIVAIFQKMRGNGMAHGVRACRLGNSGLQHSLSYRVPQYGFVKIVPLSQFGLVIDVEA